MHHTKMPKRKCKSENFEVKKYSYKRKHSLNEPLTLHIMKEMNVSPLDNSLFNEEYISKQKVLLKIQNSKKRHPEFTTPETSPSFKALRNDFVLFRKSNNFQPQDEDHFSNLSDEIILYIFQFLPKTVLIKCSEVCKRWKNLSYDETLWRRYDFGKKLVKSGVLGTLLHRGVSVLRLAMSEVKAPVFTDVEFCTRIRFSKLQYLDLSMATISQQSLANLLSVCNKLKKLSLENCPLNEECCIYIAQNSKLEVLNLSMCEGLTPYGLHKITTSCTKLKEWNLAWTYLDVLCMETFLPLLPSSLTRLNISGHRESFDDRALLTIIDRCPYMLELDISDSPMVTAVSFKTMVENCPNLQHLHTSRSYNIPAICNRLLKDMKNFKELEIFQTLNEEPLAALQKYMPEIKINQNLFSTIARPTTGIHRTSIWGLRFKNCYY